ncbi:site-specific integrase [Carboxylicivirga sp. A043]|uniref:site-specific integrase n=1 Tax=Carboxylicivirga litoralis TaxID=2816963 RepID=UPI0021CB066F|nr:site-specific integrase [Carboxylicivirga sp. A043]MCU4155238.1 site-specific integrase [Carboxylicivirga sp. A043]
MNGVTTSVILDKRIQKKDKTYAVKLRVTHNRIQKYYPINVFLTVDEWEKVHSEKPRKTYKDHLLYFNEVELKARAVVKEIHPFTFTAFEKKFNQAPRSSIDVFSAFQSYIDDLLKEGRASTSESYLCALNSLKKRQEAKRRKKLNFWDVTPDWLKEYEKWMVAEGKSRTTIGIYLRSLRTILNNAIAEGHLDRESYPFGKRKYQIPASNNKKKALTIEQIGQLVKYEPQNKYEAKARDLWLFSYLCNGVNVKDIARLKYSSISNNKIHFYRAKTERTSKHDLQEITVVLLPEIEKIIDKWGVKPIESDTYIFGIISKDDTPEQELAKVKSAIKSINKFMDRIGKNIGLPFKPTTYFARHSFATVLKRSGAPTEFIKESLGHKDLKTTEHYLDSFDDDFKESFQKKLLNF